MKKTSEEFMEFLGLKLGDRIKIDGDDRIWVVSTKRFMYRLECLNEEIVKPFGHLEGMNYEILHTSKRVGDLKCCNEIKCEQCPLRGVCTTMMAFPPMKLYDILNRYGVHKNAYFDQEIYDLLKARLDMEVEE